jgi:hypothetical protein
MKSLIIAAVLSFGAGVALAQTQETQGDKPATDMKIVTGNEAKHARHADARHCLDQKTDLQIIRCAEKYRNAR